MGMCFLYGNGGGNSQLYYDIVCQTAEPAKKEGRIWVKSSVAMNYVEWNNNPWSGGTVGRIDIGGTLGGLNPTSSNNIIEVFNTKLAGIWNRMKLTPTFCRQVQGSTGNWVNVDAYVCHSKTWVQFSWSWNGELFDNGNQYVSKTGGWQTAGGTQTSASPYLLVSNSVSNAVVGTANKIDISNYSTLHFIGQGRGDYSNGSAKIGAFGIASSYDATFAHFVSQAEIPNGYANSSTMPSLTTEKVIDISGLSGEYYIAAYVNNPGAGVSLGIKKVWLT